MIQVVMAGAIMMGLVTETQADEVVRRLRWVPPPSTASETWSVISAEMERARGMFPS